MENIICNLVVTEKCNLSCKYCYMHNNDNYMTTDIIDKLYNNIDSLVKLYNGKTFSIDFFGGEPLLNFDIIKYTVNKFKNKSNLTHLCIISNLLLLDQNKVNYIKQNAIGCSWSFDGLYNKTIRINNTNKSSTFEEYMNKISLIKSITNSCKCTITPEHMLDKSNITLANNLKFYIDELHINPDFSVSKDNSWTDEAINIFIKQLDDFADLYIKYVNEGKLLHAGFFDLILMDVILAKKVGKRSFTCFAGTSGFAIMPNGNIYPCARYGTCNRDILGNLNDNLITFSHYKYIENSNPINNKECKKCEMYLWCNSGCQFNQECFNFKPLSGYCKIYKALFKKSLYVYNKLKNNKEWLNSLHFENNERG